VAKAGVFRMPHVRVVRPQHELLLDTHIWIWNELEPCGSLPPFTRNWPPPQRTLSIPREPLGAGLTGREKRINIAADFAEWVTVNGSFEDLQMQEAPYSFAVAHELRFTQLPHRDPGDRFIVATARIYDMTLVTPDQNLIGLANLAVLPNL
jgi:PIN domain nuclease of toxin-antitoxin system